MMPIFGDPDSENFHMGNGNFSYLMIIFDYHYQIKLTLILHINYHDKHVYHDKYLFVVGMVV
jgi:hypothetical protein